MRGCIKVWMAGLLVALVMASGSTAVQGQEIEQPTYASPETATNHLVSTSVQPPADWETWKAEVDAKLAKIVDKAAADKKKAAGKPSVQVQGRIFADGYGYDQDAASISQIGDQKDGFRFDAARIGVVGKAFHVMEYKIEFDFAGTQSTLAKDVLQTPSFKDVYIAVKELPLVGNVKVGHFKEPFSLDQLTSSRHIMFMERSLMDVAFVPARNVGAMIYDHSDSENLTWALGGFISNVGDEPPVFRSNNGGLAVTTRMTYLPWYDEATNGRGLLHLGVAYSYRDIDVATIHRTKPEADLGDYLLSTGLVSPPREQLIGLEAAFVYKAFRIQSEYTKAFSGDAGSPGQEYDGFYFQASYFLTGEQRKYKRSNGTFSDRVVPFENFFRVRDCDGHVQNGKGAWELAYRISYIDLENGARAAGNATNHTFGVNWYLNPYSRVMFDYINSDARRAPGAGSLVDVTGNMNIFMTRFQIDF